MTDAHRNMMAEAVQLLLDDKAAEIDSLIEESMAARDRHFEAKKEAVAAYKASKCSSTLHEQERATAMYHDSVRAVREAFGAKQNLTRDPADCMDCVLEHAMLMADEAKLEAFLAPRRKAALEADMAKLREQLAEKERELREAT